MYDSKAIGTLLFEDDKGEPDPVTADTLSALLRDYSVPAMVLNACQSAMFDHHARDPFSSVAAALVKAGIRSVVAMAYSLYVSGAQEFLPAFYSELFESGDFSRATRAGRRQMYAQRKRVCARGRYELLDFSVPVIYNQEPYTLSFADGAVAEDKAAKAQLPEQVRDESSPYGFIGRDYELLKLERSLRKDTPAVLIQGLGGVGKTTLACGLVRWLADTGGIDGCVWFRFTDIRSADYIINGIGGSIFGKDFIVASLDVRIEALAAVLREHRIVIIWDNFEVVAGIPGTYIKATLTDQDQGLLYKLLEKMRGGKSKVIITSRSDEEWLGVERLKVSIGGLIGEERWEFCEKALDNLGIPVNRNDKDLVELMELLNGHPLAMRVVLPRLEKMTARSAIDAIRNNMRELGDDADSLYGTLRFAVDNVDDELKVLLTPLALHELYVDADLLEYMSKQIDEKLTREQIDMFCRALVPAGLLRDVGQNIYELHPALTGFLRTTHLPSIPEETRDKWSRTFVDVMGRVADQVAQMQLHQQRAYFHLHNANFHYALSEAERLKMVTDQKAIVQSLAVWSQNTRDFVEAEKLFERLKDLNLESGDEKGAASTYHQLGMIAEEQRDFKNAEKWYLKSLEISERLGIEYGAALTYHQLGVIAEEQRDFKNAEKWYMKSLEIKERQGNEHGAASTYHQLGIIAEEKRDFMNAEKWYLNAVAVFERLKDEHSAAAGYHQLGTIAEEQRDFKNAEKWYMKSLEIEERQGNEHGAASTYHQLGMIAQKQRDFKNAEKWYVKSLEIKERQGNEHGAATTYHQLGRIAEERRDFKNAEKWYMKAVAVFERLKDEHSAASTYHNLGMIAQKQRDFKNAEKWYMKSLEIKERQGNEHGAAITYGQLGIITGLQQQYEQSGKWLIKCITTLVRVNDPHGTKRNAHNFALVYRQASPDVQKKLAAMWEEAGLGPLPEIDDSKD
jgi:tetratricopeptide (TPR) repeat protein